MYYNTYLKDKAEKGKSTELLEKVHDYLSDLLKKLQGQTDKRYSYTFYDLFMGILSFRDRINGLVLSELGGYVNGAKHAPAGTKRISNLLRKANWDASLISEALEQQCKERISAPEQAGRWWLMLWDDSVIEKPESWFSEGLCAVRSSKSSRLTRIKPGYYRPPLSGQIRVPGYQWSAGILTARGQTPQIFQMRWWTTRGKHKEQGGNIFYEMLRAAARMQQQTNSSLWHVLDRGYANATTLERMIHFDQRFIIRWKSNQLLINEKGVAKATYKHSLGQKTAAYRWIWDKERKQHRKIGILYRKVYHKEFPDKPMYLVIVRSTHKGHKPMYLLTDIKIDTPGMAWEMLFCYMHRWDVEQAFRFGKTALAMESPRLWFFENRIKLLMIVTLVMSFLLQLLIKTPDFAQKLIKTWCPRTGKWQEKVSLPLYRLRLALERLIVYEYLYLFKG